MRTLEMMSNKREKINELLDWIYSMEVISEQEKEHFRSDPTRLDLAVRESNWASSSIKLPVCPRRCKPFQSSWN
jgi:hypothetical protein